MIDKLPDSQLLQFLREKSEARSDVEFDYIEQLDDLRHRVSGEVRFINQLFPEYTPHDDEYHLSRLFHVADTLIGLERYALLNATELFVLACGLYGHDWGMAVSEAERDYVVSSIVPDGFAASDFALLPDEHQRFERFVKDNGLSLETIRESGITTEDWREYVRATHAYRSGERLRLFFKNIDPGVAEATGRVCEGHWLNIEDIQNFTRYPTNFAVLRENLNLAAIAVYVRLIDLLDIGHDRTPYVIWKFVAPRDSRSKMEWNKHRALQPVTCPAYLSGRIILIDGSTADHEVYAALEDLHKYSEAQIRECTDLLARLPDSRPLLDIYHLEWRVAAIGFDPVLIQFEFDRDSVLRILSDEIYQGDPYVFLRELLQNSIDAIRMRRELLERFGGIKAQLFGRITVDVDHKPNGDVLVTWTDDGVGMDAYIVRNYLAVAGRSYYRSEEFERQGLSLDPISKFGVGILSCFMVSNLLEIETKREPYASSSTESLRIRIPAINRQFRIEKNVSLDFAIGTRVRVHLEKRLIDEELGAIDVTNYLKLIAGFVEFPIIVRERGASTTILPPGSTIDVKSDPRFINDRGTELFSVALDYPIEKAVRPQDLETARTTLVEVSFDLRRDLHLTGYEGKISFLSPRDPDARFATGRFGESGITFSSNDAIVRWQIEWVSSWVPEKPELPKSAKTPATRAIYRNGILVPDAQIAVQSDRSDAFPFPRTVINILSSGTSQLDIARTQLSNSHWFNEVHEALKSKLLDRLMAELSQTSIKDSFPRMGLFFAVFGLGIDLLKMNDRGALPVPIIGKGGAFRVDTWNNYADKPIRLFPRVLENQSNLIITSSYDNKPSAILPNWHGEDAIVMNFDFTASKDFRIQRALYQTQNVLHKYYVPTSVELLQPPTPDVNPLVQEIWEARKSQETESVYDLACKAIADPGILSAEDRQTLLKAWSSFAPPIFIPFPVVSPFVVGLRLYNLSNPIGELLFRCIAWMVRYNLDKKPGDVNSGVLSDAMQQTMYRYRRRHGLEPASIALISAARNVGLIGSHSYSPIDDHEVWHESNEGLKSAIRQASEPFGNPLKK